MFPSYLQLTNAFSLYLYGFEKKIYKRSLLSWYVFWYNTKNETNFIIILYFNLTGYLRHSNITQTSIIEEDYILKLLFKFMLSGHRYILKFSEYRKT